MPLGIFLAQTVLAPKDAYVPQQLRQVLCLAGPKTMVAILLDCFPLASASVNAQLIRRSHLLVWQALRKLISQAATSSLRREDCLRASPSSAVAREVVAAWLVMFFSSPVVSLVTFLPTQESNLVVAGTDSTETCLKFDS